MPGQGARGTVVPDQTQCSFLGYKKRSPPEGGVLFQGDKC
jgi:hypothetical protein